MRVVIFGGTGFVGSYLVETLAAKGYEPILFVRPGSEHKSVALTGSSPIVGEISDQTAIEKALDGADAAIFNIGILRENPARGITFKKLQFEAAKRCMDAAVKQNVKRFLLMSANGVNADGTEYQRTKFMAEQYLKTTALDWTIFRPSVIFGNPRGRMEFATQLNQDIVQSPLPVPLFYKGLLPLNPGSFYLAPIHVAEVAGAFTDSLQKPDTIGKTIPLCGPDEISWRSILETIMTATGRRKLMLPVPAWGVSLVASVLDRFESFPITRDQIHMLIEGNVCDEQNPEQLTAGSRPFSRENLRYLTESTQADS